ncbi:uncharacterized protein LOC112592670 [Melanaphis sacchari]|uniref:uncharacterized protein LOC112592670 n=1 Tax=Melanaphis sacchari TaxID=742174 RepID=UPI000DC15361|nr:uncharacterized protein LOC112592670 [Melanaphis sacchari]
MKIKWKNLKDNYRRKCTNKSGQAATNEKPYVYAKVLEFLRPTIENRKTQNNIMSESEEDEVESEGDEIFVVGQDINEESLLKKSFSHTQEMTKIKRTKKSQVNEIKEVKEVDLIHFLKNRPKEVEDPDKLFLLSLTPLIKDFTSDQKTQLYIEFLNAIQKIKNTSQHQFSFQRNQMPSLTPHNQNNTFTQPQLYSLGTTHPIVQLPLNTQNNNHQTSSPVYY